MQKRLVPSGTGWELYLPKDILKLLGYDPITTKVQLTIDKNILKINRIEEDTSCNNRLIKNIAKSGNGYGIYMSASVIQLLEINPEKDEVKYIIENDVLYIKRAYAT